MNRHYSKNPQKGMTMIEILIALVLGTFLIGGMMQVFLSSKQSYRLQENMSRMQENGRFSMIFLSRDIRLTDYRSCYNDTVAPVISGISGAISGTNDSGINSSDTITVGQKTNACGATDASSTVTYSIQNDASGQPALFKSINGAAALAVIEGVENMQILYGEDTDADNTPNHYVTSAAVTNMAQIISVRITLTTRTIDNNLTKTGDGRLRRTYTTTIFLRNRQQ